MVNGELATTNTDGVGTTAGGIETYVRQAPLDERTGRHMVIKRVDTGYAATLPTNGSSLVHSLLCRTRRIICSRLSYTRRKGKKRTIFLSRATHISIDRAVGARGPTVQPLFSPLDLEIDLSWWHGITCPNCVRCGSAAGQ